MSTELEPLVGSWYMHLDKGQLFTVVEVDDETSVVELQHFDGDLEEVDLAEWYEMDLELSDAPEDWTGPVDDIERDDTGYSETQMSSDAWREPLQETPREDTEGWQDAAPEDERDDWAEGENTEEDRPPGELEDDAAASSGAEQEEEDER